MATFLHSFRHKLPIRILILAALFCNLKSFALDTWGGQVGPAPSLTNTTYTINKCRELAWVASQVNGGNTFVGYTFVLADNLDLRNLNWTPIGNTTSSFLGSFNGQIHTIYNVSINSPTGYAGLFGNIGNNATISNIALSGLTVSGSTYVGSLVGYTGSSIQISNCSAVSGTITATTNHAGGLIGYTQGGVVSNSFSTCNVLSSGTLSNAGGFAGSIYQTTGSPTIFINCYTTGYTTCTGYCGGFIGSIDAGSPSYITNIINCYTTGPVLFYNYNTTTGGYGGGFVGNVSNKSIANNCFASGAIYGFAKNGGFVGSTNGNPEFIRCYFDIQGTGTTVGIGRGAGQDNQKYSLYGLSTTEITTPAIISTYLDNSTYGSGVWTFTNGYYPELTNFRTGSPGYSITSPSVTVPALTPTAEQKAWSSLSTTPLFFTDPDKSIIVANSIQAPLYTNPSIQNRINWHGAPRTGDSGLLSFDNTTGIILPASNGNYNFLTKDNSNRTKPFFVHVNKTMVYFVRVYNGLDGGTDGNGIVHDGKTWAKAFRTIQYAVDKAYSQIPKFVVWVAAGNYTQNAAYHFSSGENFRIYDGVNVFGSFKEDSTQNNGYAGMDTRFASGYSTLNGSAMNTVLAPALTELATNTTWDGFYMKGSLTDNYAVTIPGRAWLINAIIRGNKSALNLLNKSKAINIVVANNTGTSAAVALTDSAKLTNATITYNSGPAFSISGSLVPSVINSIVWRNSNNFVSAGDTAKIILKNSALSCAPDLGGQWVTFANSNNNIDLYHRSPNFKDPGKGDYDLLLISPCLDKGDPTQNTTTIDIRGKDRLYYGATSTIDMGAYQKQSNDGILVTGHNTLTYFRPTTTVFDITALNRSEILLKPTATLDASSSTLSPRLLMIQDDNTTAPIIKGTLTPDSILYVRTLIKLRADGKLMWNSFGLPFCSVRLDNIDGLIIENSVRLDQYSEPTRSTTGAFKKGWNPPLGTDWTNASLSYLYPKRGYMGIINTKVPNNSICNTLIVPAQKGTIISDNLNTATIPVTKTTSPISWTEEGWNYIANPFYTTATFTNNTGNWPSNSSYTPIYIYQPQTDTYNIVLFNTFNSSGLSAFGACFIKTDANSQVQMQTSTLGTPMRVSRFGYITTTQNIFKLQIDGNKISNNAYVIFSNDTHAEGIDSEDAPALTDATYNNLSITTSPTGSNIQLAVNSLPFRGFTMSVPLTIKLPKEGAYTLSLPEDDESTSVRLIDPNGVIHNLTNEPFVLTTDKETTLNYILLFDRSSTTNSTANSPDLISITQNREIVTVTSPISLAKIHLYNSVGQLIKTINASGNTIQFQLPSTGAFIIKVDTEKGTINRKIITP